MKKEKKLIVGNWKMNGLRESNQQLIHTVLEALKNNILEVDIAFCPPTVYLQQVQALLKNTQVQWGAQDVSGHKVGAFTGEVSATMLSEFGCRYLIIGHSERRQYHGETNRLIASKTEQAFNVGITPIICVGETLQERNEGKTQAVVSEQFSALISVLNDHMGEIVLAYEPVWAIGTGQTATPQMAQEIHGFLRKQISAYIQQPDRVRILYGGSMNSANAASLLAQSDIDGGLIGGASINSSEFIQILLAAHKAKNVSP